MYTLNHRKSSNQPQLSKQTRRLTFGARKNCKVPCSKSNWTSNGTSFDMLSETSVARGADFAKLDRYFNEKVNETCFSKTMDTPGSPSLDDLAFLED